MGQVKGEKGKGKSRSAVVDYVCDLDVTDGTKFFVFVLIRLGRRVVTPKYIREHTCLKKRTIRNYLYNLRDAGVLGYREDEGAKLYEYYINDHHLIAAMVEDKKRKNPFITGGCDEL